MLSGQSRGGITFVFATSQTTSPIAQANSTRWTPSTVGRDPFDPQFVQRLPELRSQRISPQLFSQRLRAGLAKNAGFIGVMGQGTSLNGRLSA